jgi:hypothetical protein
MLCFGDLWFLVEEQWCKESVFEQHHIWMIQPYLHVNISIDEHTRVIGTSFPLTKNAYHCCHKISF